MSEEIVQNVQREGIGGDGLKQTPSAPSQENNQTWLSWFGRLITGGGSQQPAQDVEHQIEEPLRKRAPGLGFEKLNGNLENKTLKPFMRDGGLEQRGENTENRNLEPLQRGGNLENRNLEPLQRGGNLENRNLEPSGGLNPVERQLQNLGVKPDGGSNQFLENSNQGSVRIH